MVIGPAFVHSFLGRNTPGGPQARCHSDGYPKQVAGLGDHEDPHAAAAMLSSFGHRAPLRPWANLHHAPSVTRPFPWISRSSTWYQFPWCRATARNVEWGRLPTHFPDHQCGFHLTGTRLLHLRKYRVLTDVLPYSTIAPHSLNVAVLELHKT